MKTYLTQILFLISIFSFAQEKTTIRISVPNKSDEVYIVGNQDNLGNWQPDKIKMVKTSDYQREISVELKLPAEFKFTRGKWENEAKVVDFENNIKINEKSSIFNFEIENWKDEKKGNGKLSLTYDIKYISSKYYPNEERTLKVFLPKNYNADKKYPVIYTLDSESLFDLVIQNVSFLQDEKISENNIIPECIVVGIDNTNRNRDLFPNDGTNKEITLQQFLPNTEIFNKILNEEIVPFIEKNYSVSNYNIIIGHSDSGHFVTNLFLREDNIFDGIIALSVNDFETYFKDNRSKILNPSSKSLFLGFGSKDDEFNILGRFLVGEKNSNPNFMVKEYNADHMQLPFSSINDGIKFIFSDYKYYDSLIEKYYTDDFNYNNFEKIYSENIKQKYGIDVKIEYEIYYLLNKARDKNNPYVFNKILDEIDNSNSYQLQIRFYASNEFNQNERAKNYLYKMLESNDETDKLIFYAMLKTQYKTFFIDKIKQTNEFINFIEKAKNKWPEYKLEYNYLILKVANEQNFKIGSKSKEYFKYCKNNYKENRYFKMTDLEKIK